MLAKTTEPLQVRQQKAEVLLENFSKYAEEAGYWTGSKNPYRKYLESNPTLTTKQIVDFICFWFPISRHQPQILLQCIAAYPRWNDRKINMPNYTEEDAMLTEGYDPHYFLLEELIWKLDNNFKIDKKVVIDGQFEIDDRYMGDEQANEMVTKFHDTLYKKMTEAEATGLIAAIEHPALDISFYFNKIVQLCGQTQLLKSDPYLLIHIDVEPDHILWAHGHAGQYMKDGKTDEVITAFKNCMSFWTEFWAVAFTKLGYPG
jgi:hypothetical protein